MCRKIRLLLNYANDLIIGALGIDDLNPAITSGSGFAQIMPVQSSYGASGEDNAMPRSVWSEWSITKTPVTNLPVNCTFNTTKNWAIILDAVRLVVAPPPSPVSLSPNSGPIGQVVAVSGQGFQANSKLAALFDTVPVPFSYSTDASGNIPSGANLTVPQGSTAGAHTVTVFDGKYNYANATFTVTTPNITLTPKTGPVGTSVTVTGSNFIDNSPITINFTGNLMTTNPSSLTADTTGSFSATFSASGPLPAGSQTVSASDGVNSANAIFTVTSSISISPTRSLTGTPITIAISGQGYAANSQLQVTFGGNAVSTTPATVFTDASGSFSNAIFTAQSSTTGSKTVSVMDASNNAATATFNFVALARFAITGCPASTTAGSGFGSITVTAYDSSSNVIDGYLGTVYFTSTDSQVILPNKSASPYTFNLADKGAHVFSGFTLETAGTQTITVTDGTILQTSNGITVNPASASSLVVSGFPNPTTANVARTLMVKATDPYGNTATSYRGTIYFTSTDLLAALPTNYQFIASDNGAVTFTVTLKTAGVQSITATDTTALTVTGVQTGITVNPALVAPTISATASAVDQGQYSGLSSTAVTTGTSPYSYQWLQKAPGFGSYSAIGGATSISYVFVTTVSTALGTWSFELQVTDSLGAQVMSGAVSVTVTAVPIVTVSPTSWAMDLGQSGQTFTATATGGSGSYTSYQWYVNGALQGSTASTFSFAPTSTGSYSLTATVTDSLGIISAQSSPASFTAHSTLAAPTLTATPATVYQGTKSSLTSTAISTGTSPYTYQWLQAFNAGAYSPISGAITPSYNFATTSSTATGVYSFELRVTDSASNAVTVTSNAVSVTVKPSHFVDAATVFHDTPNVGTHSSFPAMQAGPDGTYDTLTEANVGGGTGTFGSSTGTTSTQYSSDDFYGSVYTSPIDAQGATISSLTANCKSASSGGNSRNVKAIILNPSTKTILGISNPTVVTTTQGDFVFTFGTPVTISASTQYVIGLIADGTFYFYYGTGTANQGYADTSNSYTTPTYPTDATFNTNAYRLTVTYTKVNYHLDLEAQFTTVNNYATFTQLQIQTGTFSSPAETITVDYWNGGWVSLGTLTSNTLNTFTVTLTSNAYQIKFVDGTQTGDTVQSTWQIDSVCLVAP